MSFSSFLGKLFWIFILRLLRKKTPMETFTNSSEINKENLTNTIDANITNLTNYQIEALQNFSNNKLNETRKRTIYRLSIM